MLKLGVVTIVVGVLLSQGSPKKAKSGGESVKKISVMSSNVAKCIRGFRGGRPKVLKSC